jgi:glycosyltransferase involved in cell wall biosynthesis
MEQNSVSVIIPVHNGAEYIASALRSVLSQTQPAQEIFVIDDGSKDDLDQALAPFRAQITLLRHPQALGVSAARNTAITAASGEWLAFLDHDDEWLPRKTELQLQAVEGRPEIGLIYGDMEVFGDITKPSRLQNLPTPRGRVFKELLLFNFITPSAAIARRAAVLEVGGFDDTFENVQDRDLCLRLAACWEVEYVPEALTRYRVHAGNMSKNRSSALRDLFRLLQKAQNFSPADYQAVWPQVRHNLAEISFELGRMNLAEGDLAEAKTWFRRSANYPDHRARALAYLAAARLPHSLHKMLRRGKRALLGRRAYYHD